MLKRPVLKRCFKISSFIWSRGGGVLKVIQDRRAWIILRLLGNTRILQNVQLSWDNFSVGYYMGLSVWNLLAESVQTVEDENKFKKENNLYMTFVLVY